MEVNQASAARIAVALEGSTGDLVVETCARYGNVETDLPGASLVDFPSNGSPTQLSANGLGWLNGGRILDTGKQLVELGVAVANGTAGAPQLGVVTLTIDLKE